MRRSGAPIKMSAHRRQTLAVLVFVSTRSDPTIALARQVTIFAIDRVSIETNASPGRLVDPTVSARTRLGTTVASVNLAIMTLLPLGVVISIATNVQKVAPRATPQPKLVLILLAAFLVHARQDIPVYLQVVSMSTNVQRCLPFVDPTLNATIPWDPLPAPAKVDTGANLLRPCAATLTIVPDEPRVNPTVSVKTRLGTIVVRANLAIMIRRPLGEDVSISTNL